MRIYLKYVVGANTKKSFFVNLDPSSGLVLSEEIINKSIILKENIATCGRYGVQYDENGELDKVWLYSNTHNEFMKNMTPVVDHMKYIKDKDVQHPGIVYHYGYKIKEDQHQFYFYLDNPADICPDLSVFPSSAYSRAYTYNSDCSKMVKINDYTVRTPFKYVRKFMKGVDIPDDMNVNFSMREFTAGGKEYSINYCFTDTNTGKALNPGIGFVMNPPKLAASPAKARIASAVPKKLAPVSTSTSSTSSATRQDTPEQKRLGSPSSRLMSQTSSSRLRTASTQKRPMLLGSPTILAPIAPRAGNV